MIKGTAIVLTNGWLNNLHAKNMRYFYKSLFL